MHIICFHQSQTLEFFTFFSFFFFIHTPRNLTYQWVRNENFFAQHNYFSRQFYPRQSRTHETNEFIYVNPFNITLRSWVIFIDLKIPHVSHHNEDHWLGKSLLLLLLSFGEFTFTYNIYIHACVALRQNIKDDARAHRTQQFNYLACALVEFLAIFGRGDNWWKKRNKMIFLPSPRRFLLYLK